MMRHRTTVTACALGLATLLMSACSTGTSSESASDVPLKASAETTEPAPTVTVEVLAIETAAQVFLAAACLTEAGLHNVENVAIAAGGWASAPAKKIRNAATQAVTAISETASLLTQETRWPPELQADVRSTTDEILALASPLQDLADAPSGTDRSRYWARVEKSSRVAEQRLRLSLGVGLARSTNDGCPPAPKVVPPRPEPSPSSVAAGQAPTPATGPMPSLTGPMIESTSDAICYLDPYSMPPLVGPNSDSWATRLIQIFAVMNGFNPGPIDGQYGPKTVAAVIQLQTLVGVVPDGQVGPITWGALSRFHCPR